VYKLANIEAAVDNKIEKNTFIKASSERSL